MLNCNNEMARIFGSFNDETIINTLTSASPYFESELRRGQDRVPGARRQARRVPAQEGLQHEAVERGQEGLVVREIGQRLVRQGRQRRHATDEPTRRSRR